VSAVVGIDFSTFYVDLVKLDETDAAASWLRVELAGANAWDRTRALAYTMPLRSWWDDVYLAAIERPMMDQQRVLARVQGVILARIPATVHCWEVRPDEWKKPLGLKITEKPDAAAFPGMQYVSGPNGEPWTQDAYDALGVALYARETNRKGIAA
jgi:hypothetical protein